MVTFKLHYFDVQGRAYPIRFALEAKGISYENVLIGFTPEERERYPMKAVPVLEVDGKFLCQTEAIMNYLGPMTGMVPTDPWLAAKHSELLGCFNDLFGRLFPSMMESDPEKKKALREVFVTYLKGWLSNVEAIVKGNATKSGFAVAEHITFADVWLFHTMKTIKKAVWDHVPADVCDSFPSLMRVHAAVLASPEKKKYDAAVKEGWR